MPTKTDNHTTQEASQIKYGTCNICTRQLVEIAYSRAPWFRLIREPLVLGMKTLGTWHGIDAEEYHVYTDDCRGCLRFTKSELKKRSLLFSSLNRAINPIFDRILESIVGKAEVATANRYAREATQGPDKDSSPKA